MCDVLELEPKHVKPRLNSEDTNKVANTDPNRGRGNPYIITVNESGLYDVIFQSRKPEAKRFRRWVTNEVLPAIRKTGAYISDSILIRGRCWDGENRPIAGGFIGIP